jgi:hypothetical protein
MTALGEQTIDLSEAEDFFDKIREKIIEKTYHVQDPTKRFITIDDQKKIWGPTELEKVKGILGLDDEQFKDLKESFLRTLTILIKIHWRKWREFKSLFLEPPAKDAKGKYSWTDKHIFTCNIEGLSRLGSNHMVYSFMEHRHAFQPIVIEERQIIVEKSIQWRLPFLPSKETRVLGEGSYGKVTMETIAPGHYRHAGEGSDENTVLMMIFEVVRNING